MRLTEYQIEQAAEALRDHVANRSGRGRPWRSLPESMRQSYRDEVKAVINALEGL